MNFKETLKKVLAARGYEISRTTAPHGSMPPAGVLYGNFVDLTQAYEQRRRESGAVIAASDTRARLLARLEGTLPSEAYYLVEALALCGHVEGDVCEFGVAQGETSALIADEIRHREDKVLHLFDSFEGLPTPSAHDKLKDDIWALGSIEAYSGTMSFPERMVRARLAAIGFPPERFVVHKGFIERLIDSDATMPQRVSFAYLDFDFYEPTRIALDFLHKVTTPGAVIIVDDYDFFSTGPKKAVDEFVAGQTSDATIYECVVPDARYGHFAVLTRMA
jgi:hypothetical protein